MIWSSSSFNMLIPSPFLTTFTAPLARMNAMSLNHSTCPPCVYRLNSLYTREFCALFCFKELLQLTDCSEIVKNFKLNVSVIYLLSLYFFVTTHSIRTHTKSQFSSPTHFKIKKYAYNQNPIKHTQIFLHFITQMLVGILYTQLEPHQSSSVSEVITKTIRPTCSSGRLM